MPCPESIPNYLHRNNRPKCSSDEYLNDHRLYSVQTKDNPVKFPNTLTAISCKWSAIIKEEDVVKSNEPPIGNDYKFAIVEEVRGVNVSIEKRDKGTQEGWHTLSCVIEHAPEECEYSHSEILIKHVYVSDEAGEKVTKEHIITYDDWVSKKTILTKGNAIISQLKGKYRLELIKLFCYPSNIEGQIDTIDNPASL